uniref:IRG-type G domain-containing protein n=1 Tax=Acrobeloides nanus TaxID=290746 RepID=A0A914BVA3_9BILA
MGNDQSKREAEEYKEKYEKAERDKERLASKVEVQQEIAAREALKETEDMNIEVKEHNTVTMSMYHIMIQEFRDELTRVCELFNAKPVSAKPDKCPEEMIEKARRKMGLDTANFYNIGFAGHVNTGKSSLINAIRGLTGTHEMSASVSFTESTMKVKYYMFPDDRYPHVRFYENPRSDKMSFRTEDYFEENDLCAFDCLLILVQATLGQEEISYAKMAIKYHQPVAFIRSRCDMEISNLYDNDKQKCNLHANYDANCQLCYEDVKNVMKKFKSNYEEIIRTRAPELTCVPIYFVSARILRELVTARKPKYMFEETNLLEFIRYSAINSRDPVPNKFK